MFGIGPGHFVSRGVRGKIDGEAYRRRIFAQVCIAIALPVLMVYGVADLQRENPLMEAGPNFVMMILLLVTSVTLRFADHVMALLRLAMAGMTGLLLLAAYTGFSGGMDAMWWYTYPLFAMHIFPKQEGLIWSVPSVGLVSAMVIAGAAIGAYPYPPAFAMRYIPTLVIVTGLSYTIESLRHKFWHQLQRQKSALNEQNDRLHRQKTELETAMNELRTLSGMLPICATCKNVRDDQGYWQSIEQYLHTHTATRFSHGICVSCLKEQDPQMYREMLEAGEITEVSTPTHRWTRKD